jgi:hypothetical protein
MVSEGSSPVDLGRTSWWRECVAEELLHFMVNRKQRKGTQEGARVTFLPLGPTPFNAIIV